MDPLTFKQAKYLENKYLFLTGKENKLGKVKALIVTHYAEETNLDTGEQGFYKVLVAIFTSDPLHDKFYDLEYFCNKIGVEFSMV